MAKIKKIEVNNLKAISEQSADFNGCSAIVTAGNNKGKTTLLKTLIDRMRGIKPDIIVKQGEENGFYNMELTDGSKIEWKFTTKSESFNYTTPEGFDIKSGVIGQIGQRYFGTKFDIDKFLLSTPKDQSRILGRLVGVNFEEIDLRYKVAYDKRTDANKELKRVQALKFEAPLAVGEPKESEAVIKQQIAEEKARINKASEQARQKHEKEVSDYDSAYKKAVNEINAFNQEQQTREKDYIALNEQIAEITNLATLAGLAHCWDLGKANEKLATLPKAEILKNIDDINLVRPTFNWAADGTKLSELETKLEQTQQQQIKYNNYVRELAEFNKVEKDLKAASEAASKADQDVKAIENEKLEMIKGAKIPAEFSFNEDGILYNGLPLTNEQTSSSAKYIAALKLNMLVLGELRTMHFDASFLDKFSLAEIENWANENDLQLLIERPDFDGADFKYEILSQ